MKNILTYPLSLHFLCFIFSTTINAQRIDGDSIVGEQLIASRFDEKTMILSDWESTDSIIYFYNDQGQEIEKRWLSYSDTGWILSGRQIFNYLEAENQQIETFQGWQNEEWVNRARYTLEFDDAWNEIRWQYEQFEWYFWKNVSLELKTYNSNGQLLNLIKQSSHGGGQWVNQYCYQYEYDLQGNLIYENSKQFIAFEWVNQSCRQYEYDLQGNLIYENTKKFIAGEWELQKEEEYSYAPNQQLKLWVTKFWENGEIDYEVHCKHEIDSIPIGYISSEFFLENDIWELANQETFLYNSQNHLILHQQQAVRNGVLVNIAKDTFIYNEVDHGRIEQITHSQGNLDAWTPQKQTNYTYNDNGLLTDITQEKWDGTNWFYFPPGSYEFKYSETGELVEKIIFSGRINEGGSPDDDFLIYFRETLYYYHPLSVSLKESPSTPNLACSIFPNPTKNYFYVHLDKFIDKLALKIYNTKGQLVKEDIIQEQLKFVSVIGLTKGLYFVQLTNGQQQVVRKIRVQ